MKDNQRLMITQRNGDGALYSTGSVNMFHEVIDGYIQDIDTGAIIKELTAKEVIDIINMPKTKKSYTFNIKVATEMGTASVKHTIQDVSTLDEALTKVKASLQEAYGDNYKIHNYEEVKQ